MSDTHGSGPTVHGDDVQRMGARTSLEERTLSSEVRPPGIVRTVTSRDEVRDRVRWGPLWAGLVVLLAVNLLLQMVLVTTGALSLDSERTGLPEGALLSAGAALLAFFLGGLVAGASTMRREADDGLFHGVMLWALAVVAILVLVVLGGGAALGAATDVANDLGVGAEEIAQSAEGVEQQEATDRVRDAAGAVLLGLGLTFAAAVLGGIAGSKMWPSKRDRSDDAASRPRAGLSQ